jgi:hypothetical protein
MSDPRDDAASAPGPAGAQSGKPDIVQPRKPRIEVLRSAPAADPAPGSTRRLNESRTDAATAASPEFARANPLWLAPDQRPQGDTQRARGRGGQFRSRTIPLIILAAFVLAGLLLYTYLSNENDASEYAAERRQASSADAQRPEDLQSDGDLGKTREPVGPPATTRIDEVAPEPAPSASFAPERAAASQTRQATVDAAPEEPAPATPVISDDDASGAVLAFYSALSSGDGASAAQRVIPEKRQSGPLSANALSRYYSSFRRPLRVRSVAVVNASTVRVAYDYVLADGRLCRGKAAVRVVRRDGRSLVSRITTQGPC